MIPIRNKWTLGLLFLALGIAAACGQFSTVVGTTNEMYFWAQDLKFSLTGVTPGEFSTNGIIARTHAIPLKITSRDIIKSLNGQVAYTIGRGFAEFPVSVTTINVPNDPIDQYTTNLVSVAYPVRGAEVAPSYSPQARLMLLQPLGLARRTALPFVVVRDGVPAVDYMVDLDVSNLQLAAGDSEAVLSGKFDVLHELASVTRYAMTKYVYPAAGSAPRALMFDVSGYTTELVQAVIVHTNAVDPGAIKALTAAVAGNGTVTNFCVLRGTVSTQGGKLEIK